MPEVWRDPPTRPNEWHGTLVAEWNESGLRPSDDCALALEKVFAAWLVAGSLFMGVLALLSGRDAITALGAAASVVAVMGGLRLAFDIGLIWRLLFRRGDGYRAELLLDEHGLRLMRQGLSPVELPRTEAAVLRMNTWMDFSVLTLTDAQGNDRLELFDRP